MCGNFRALILKRNSPKKLKFTLFKFDYVRFNLEYLVCLGCKYEISLLRILFGIVSLGLIFLGVLCFFSEIKWRGY
jgi:hypothetical protein